MFCFERFKNIYRLKGKYCKTQKYKKWNKVSEEAGEDGVSGFERRTTTEKYVGCPLVNCLLSGLCFLCEMTLPLFYHLLTGLFESFDSFCSLLGNHLVQSRFAYMRLTLPL